MCMFLFLWSLDCEIKPAAYTNPVYIMREHALYSTASPSGVPLSVRYSTLLFLHVSVVFVLCRPTLLYCMFTQLSRLVSEHRVAYPKYHCRHRASRQNLLWPLQQPNIAAAKVSFICVLAFTWGCFWLQIESRVQVTSCKLDCDKFDLSELQKMILP